MIMKHSYTLSLKYQVTFITRIQVSIGCFCSYYRSECCYRLPFSLIANYKGSSSMASAGLTRDPKLGFEPGTSQSAALPSAISLLIFFYCITCLTAAFAATTVFLTSTGGGVLGLMVTVLWGMSLEVSSSCFEEIVTCQFSPSNIEL